MLCAALANMFRSLCLALLVMMAAAVAVFVAWIGAVLNTASLPSKTWCVVLLVVGLLGLPFIAALVYVIAGPDGTLTGDTAGSAAPPSRIQSGQPAAPSGGRG